MPKTAKARKAAFAEIGRRKEGAKPKLFKDIGTKKLTSYAKKPLEKRKKGA